MKRSTNVLCGYVVCYSFHKLSGTFKRRKVHNLANGMRYVEDVNGDVFPLLQGVRDQINLQRVWYADDKYNLVKKLQNEIRMKITLRKNSKSTQPMTTQYFTTYKYHCEP